MVSAPAASPCPRALIALMVLSSTGMVVWPEFVAPPGANRGGSWLWVLLWLTGLGAMARYLRPRGMPVPGLNPPFAPSP